MTVKANTFNLVLSGTGELSKSPMALVGFSGEGADFLTLSRQRMYNTNMSKRITEQVLGQYLIKQKKDALQAIDFSISVKHKALFSNPIHTKRSKIKYAT